MESQFFKICALALIATVSGVIIKQIKKELSFAIKAAGGILIFGILIISVEPLIHYLGLLSDKGFGEEYVKIMLKSLGVAIIAHVSAGICRDCGEESAVGGIELAAKIEILVLCIPMIEKILDYVCEMISIQG